MFEFSGILLVDKPGGITSYDVVHKVKKKFNCKVGHGGTLDPLATGLLPLLINDSTKISNYLLNGDKKYGVSCKLGITTNTLDSEGEILEQKEVPHFSEQKIIENLNSFLGKQDQIPPMFSAVKKGGVPLYKLARKGKTIDREPRKIEIYSINLKSWEYPVINFEVSCSKGTYIRQLVHDLGQNLDTGAHVIVLRRLVHGDFNISQTRILEDILSLTEENFEKLLISKAQALSFMKSIVVDIKDAKSISHGKSLSSEDFAISDKEEKIIILDDNGNLLAICNIVNRRVKPERVFQIPINLYINRQIQNNRSIS
jgi:tRNA pseudouridine55 synthase